MSVLPMIFIAGPLILVCYGIHTLLGQGCVRIYKKEKAMITRSITYVERLIHKVADLQMSSVKRIYAYPAVVLTAIVTLIVGTSTAANADAAYAPEFTCEGTCAIINDAGQQVIRIKNEGASRAWTDSLATWIANHDNATIRVCVKARTNRDGLAPSVGGGGNLDPGEYWAVWLPNVWSGQYSVVCRNVFLPDGAAPRMRIGATGSTDANLLVRYVQLTVP